MKDEVRADADESSRVPQRGHRSSRTSAVVAQRGQVHSAGGSQDQGQLTADAPG